MIYMFSDQFPKLFPTKIFSAAEIQPEIDDIGKKTPLKMGKIHDMAKCMGGF